MTKKPLIAITPSIDPDHQDLKLRPTYIRALEAAGAIPLILPLELPDSDFKMLAALCDGFLFSGGGDIHPSFFGEDTLRGCGSLSLLRDQAEQKLLLQAMELQKPILGICRGLQIINIFLGGDIYQDLDSQLAADFPIAHRQPYGYATPSHQVALTSGSLLQEISLGAERLWVNSMHHQAVRKLAPGLSISAKSQDGLTEAVELPGYPFLIGVQWHPEHLWPKDPAAKNLFEALVQAC